MPQRNKKQSYQHWNTPPEVLDPLHAFAPICLDPCSNAGSIVGAKVSVCEPDDGLAVSWRRYSHTFVNPPYDNQPDWMYKAMVESTFYEAPHITMLIPASTETVAFQEFVFGSCDVVCFWKRRLEFWRDGAPVSAGNTLPSALCYWGVEPERFADHFKAYGRCMTKWV